MTISIRELHEKRLAKSADYAKEYASLEDEFAVASEVIRARKEAGLTQVQLAERMETTQAVIARMEGGSLPSIRTLQRLAEATGTHLRVSFEAS